jgi:formate hydrogenlyase subunit 7
MLRLLPYLWGQGVATSKEVCPPVDDNCLGMPALTDKPCQGTDCGVCEDICPTQAIKVIGQKQSAQMTLDLGACIACGLCVDICPTGTIISNKSTRIAVENRQELVLSTAVSGKKSTLTRQESDRIFRDSLAIRVVSTGCGACDLEMAATSNPLFDMERFGVQLVASPRFADALLVTGPVGRGMHDALLRCYEAMPEPRKVIAAGTCAVSGGLHRAGYAAANGVDALIPVDVYIPGCPPHPWSMLHGIFLAMDRLL